MELATFLNTEHYREARELVNSFFNDEEKATLWMITDNPLLGNQCPMDMLMRGRGDKLLKFIKQQLDENERP